MALFTGVQHLCTFNIVPLRLYHLLPNVWKASYTISASFSVDVPYWPLYSTDKFISCVVPGPSQWSFHFGEEIVIAWTPIGWARWLIQNFPLPAGQEVRDSSNVWLLGLSWTMIGFYTTQCFTQYLKAFLCTTTSCHFNFHPVTLLYFCKHDLRALALSLWKSTF